MTIFLLILIITISLRVMRQSYLLIEKNKLILQKISNRIVELTEELKALNKKEDE